MNIHSSAHRIGALVTVAALAACSGGGGHAGSVAPQAGDPSRSVGAVARATGGFDVTVAQGADVPVRFNTTPGARCTFDGAQNAKPFYADPDGLVVIHVMATPGASAAATANITCAVGGATVKSVPVATHLIPGRVAPVAVKQGPPADATPAQVAAAKARYGFDFDLASPAELAAHDLPPRPNEQHAYMGWLRTVVSPTTHVSHAKVATSLHHGGLPDRPGTVASGNARRTESTTTTSSTNWSGYVVTGSTYTFETASGEWYVPTVSTSDNRVGDAAMWVGVDGWSDYVVLQQGSDSDVLYNSGGYYYTQYFLWEEYYPANYNVLTYSVSPGDDVWCENQTQYPTSSSANLVYYCKNNTTGFVASGTDYNPGGGATFYGNSVEWILERAQPNLSDFGTVVMNGAYGAYTSSGSWFNYSQVDNLQVNMIYSGTTLDQAYPPSPGSWSIDWTWYNYI